MVLDVVESQTRACGHECEREKSVGGADKKKNLTGDVRAETEKRELGY